MRTRAARLAWFSSALFLLSLCLSGWLKVLNESTPRGEEQPSALVDVGFFLLLLTFATVGAVIASRQPRNPIGWIFASFALALALAGLSEEYALYSLRTAPGTLPGGAVMGWLASWLQGPSLFALIVLLVLLFPNGRLLGPRWRPVLWVTLISVGLVFLLTFKAGELELSSVSVTNPFGIEGSGKLLDLLGLSGYALMLVAAVLSAISIMRRFRRARGVERLQLKWFMWAAALFGTVLLLSPVFFTVGGRLTELLWPLLFVFSILAIPVAAGIALLRYRLYDIDVVINRTLVYGALTASLALVYVGSVLLLQLAFGPLTSDNALAVAGSTLAVAALFRPIRSRIQATVDRRFYRRRYDAARTLEAFSARLRDEIDLDALGAELRGVVRDAMQPAHVSLWLRLPGARP